MRNCAGTLLLVRAKRCPARLRFTAAAAASSDPTADSIKLPAAGAKLANDAPGEAGTTPPGY
jgi:hypothetical protein